MACRRSSSPSPVRHETGTDPGNRERRVATPIGSARSHFDRTTISGTSRTPGTSARTSRTARTCPAGSWWDESTTWSSRSAAPASSRVERKASTSWVGSRRTNPTVSVSVKARPDGVSARRTVGSTVAKSAFSTRTPAPVSLFRREDLPAFVYPTTTAEGVEVRLRSARRCRRAGSMRRMSRRSLAMRVRMRRRSSSSWVSPGPREPIPAPEATRPPACRDIDSPQPRRRGRRYSSWASSTWALPSREVACRAKMSRINAVRSMTLTPTTSSSSLLCEGASSESAMTVSASRRSTIPASSRALPEPR